MIAIGPSAWHIWQKGSVRFEFQRISSRRIGPDGQRLMVSIRRVFPGRSVFLADMEANSRNTSRRSRQLSDEEIKTRIEESRKGYDEAMATLAECQRKLREGGPLVREGAEKARQEALRFREEARKKNR